METNRETPTRRNERLTKTTRHRNKLIEQYNQVINKNKQIKEQEKQVMTDLIVEFSNLVQIINENTGQQYTHNELIELEYDKLYEILENINEQSKKLI